ncbi:hypothetical protein MPTK1_7g19280 [Marchantia polymorpha subsp. ruderalis]|uniref:Uncharacterized protein n=2 Tax=Marchantia polymorpha TaxID=3197 RepID=A0AAF6C1D9_MARPO|nr:hypothetical protein MARPO_0067s0050 [Marchantia polymorpha]BBN18073.1 hypothetical protein Mp_7g19280 [Marchantia polymorpha subsp. ruderalis]|eukprot:PTQ35961.1 hypothetical protein MARPO_0067s0050 [Marchantia polymorpha]
MSKQIISSSVFFLPLVLVAILPASHGQSCETALDSPLAGHLDLIISYMKLRGFNQCCQKECNNESCSTLLRMETASLKLCSNPCTGCISCGDIATCLSKMRASCCARGRVQGTMSCGKFTLGVSP